MTQPDLSQRLDSLVATWENEVVEFKQAGDNYSTDDIGKYFSALATKPTCAEAMATGWCSA